MNSSTKKLIASFAALQILVYHYRIPVFQYGTFAGDVERFLTSSTYQGVDLFFFISAFALVSRPVDDYAGFIKNRAIKLMPLFIIAWISGHFMWFIPSIMVMYIALPPIRNKCSKRPLLSFFLLFACWAGIVFLVLGILRPAQDIGIFLFRIPSIILGAFAAGYTKLPAGRRKTFSVRQKLILGLLLLAAGMVLMYKFGYTDRLNTPFRGTFYLTGIPAMLGTVLIACCIPSDRIPRIIEYFGSMTLELYFAQMVFGTLLIGLFFGLTGSRIATNLLTAAAIIAVGAVVKIANDAVMERISPARSATAPRTP